MRGRNLRILVVDDGSTDDTADVVQRYGHRVRYIAKDNGGQASALNVGLREAEGDIICLLDADDYFYPDKVQLVADAFRRRPEVGLVYTRFDIVDGAGASLRKACPESTWTGCHLTLSKVSDQLPTLILLGHPWTCVTSAMAVRRSVVANLQVPEEVFPRSVDLFLGLVLPFLAEVAIIETAATAYVYHGENMELFRSSAVNRAMHERQMDYIRHVVEERFGVHFLRYCGRSIYDIGGGRRVGVRRFADYMRECRYIAAADVEPVIKRRSHAKLAASMLLPDALYVALRELRATYRAWQSRQLRRTIAEARR